jgi:UDP-N-acetylmuramoylalanine--D-glutamate ligase
MGNLLANKRVGILGYGREGQSVARYLNRHGIVPVLFDKNSEIEAGELPRHVGPDYLTHLSEVEVLFRSPGFWRLDPHLLEFEKAGGVITSQTNLFFEQCPCPIVGVTGTKGKGTTTTLAYQMAKQAGKKAYLTGNIGNAEEPLDFLDTLSADSLVFYELSSFQLQDLKKSPHIAVVLMVTADHLDHHGSVGEYHQAKQTITEFQKTADFAIINKDFPASATIGSQGNGQKLWISNTKVDFGIYIDQTKLYAKGLAEYGVPDGLLLEAQELNLKGLHNLQNISGALLAGAALRLPLATMLETAKSFAGLEHRLEFVLEKNGVEFYNDSFSTTPETAIAAITAFDQPLYLILGGSEKFLDYSELAKKIAARPNIATIFLIGETSGRMEQALREAKVNPDKISASAPNLEEIFHRLHFLARPGSIVLLSPATASFGLFKSYKERGEIFKQLARTW